MHTWKESILLTSLIAFMLIMALGMPTCSTFGGLDWEYSSGFRDGTLTKFSKKGIAFKTWEGEAVLGGVRTSDSGAVANIWSFSVIDQEVAKQVNDALSGGKRLRFYYRQVLIRDWKDSDTDYHVYKVEELK